MKKLIAVVLLCLPVAATAQTRNPGAPSASEPALTKPVMFVLAENFTADSRMTAFVNRDPKLGTELIAIKRSAISPELVFAAVKAYGRSVERHGEMPQHRAMVYFLSSQRLSPITPAQRAFADNLVRRLLGAGTRAVSGMSGMHPATEFVLGKLP
jgi:hypothetical protein